MKPALSVIFFTVLSGAGYGLWCLFGIALAADIYPLSGADIMVPLAFGCVLVTVGLLASTAHLGRPERAWRALSQWRSSWLSREGVTSLATYVPMLGVAWCALRHVDGLPLRITGALLALGALATLYCTANIYRSLKTIQAWRTPQVLPLFYAFALLSGGLWLWVWLDVLDVFSLRLQLVLLALALVAGVVKSDYWRRIDHAPANTAGHATGLEFMGRVRAFEGPVTEESYLAREMAFVLARKHAARLRSIALVLFAVVPVAGIAITVLRDTAWISPLLALACLAGVFVERWLFFAQARHAVAAYFPRQQA